MKPLKPAEVPLAEKRRVIARKLREGRRIKWWARMANLPSIETAWVDVIADALLEIANEVATKPRARGTGSQRGRDQRTGLDVARRSKSMKNPEPSRADSPDPQQPLDG